MAQEISRELAALVAVVSVALVGVAIALVPRAWERFVQRFVNLSSPERKVLRRYILVILIPVLLLVATATVVGVYWPNLVQAVVLLVVLFLMAIAILFLPVLIILRRKKDRPPQRLDALSLYYSLALLFLTTSIVCGLFALLGVSATMLNIELGPYGPDNFDWGRWSLHDAIFFFVTGIYLLGYAYIVDKAAYFKTKKG